MTHLNYVRFSLSCHLNSKVETAQSPHSLNLNTKILMYLLKTQYFVDEH